MDVSTETIALRRQLEKAISSDDAERMNDVMRSLDDVDMNLAALRESKVGAAVSKLKKYANQEVSNSAKALVRKWKKVAEASGLAAASKPEKSEAGKGRPEAEGSHEAAEAKQAAGTTTESQPGKGSAAEKEFSVEVEVDNLINDGTLAPMRTKMRRKMMDTLLLGASEDVDRVLVARVAVEVEEAMEANSPYASKKDDYLGKARQLVFNLKKNDQLREDVRDAIVAAERLVVMTSTELMAKDRREAMDRAVSERTEARMLDWAEKNQDKINKQCGIKSQEGMFECGRCKSKKTTYTQKQTRSADEPMTTFVTCSNCKNRWKFC